MTLAQALRIAKLQVISMRCGGYSAALIADDSSRQGDVEADGDTPEEAIANAVAELERQLAKVLS